MNDSGLFDKLFIFEMANNHMGSVEHGLKIIRQVHQVSKDFPFKFAFKFQFRDLATFIHPDYQARMDLKYVKRFSETSLEPDQFKILKVELDQLGFISVCTPFDEKSVDLIEKMDFSIIKIASCSFTDWPLLERIVRTSQPLIASTAGAKLEEIDKVVSFLEHRKKTFALLHCVAEYPTQDKNLELNQIDLFKERYPQAVIGYSTHEDPNNFAAVKIAVAKGASLFEKHVGVKADKIDLNSYSADPQQIRSWLESARQAFEMCGIRDKRLEFSPQETAGLRALGRGVFARKSIKKDDPISLADVFLAIPLVRDQIMAGDFSKYTEFWARSEIKAQQPVLVSNIRKIDNREKIYAIVQRVKQVLKAGKVNVPGRLDLEISHHYGVERFDEYGCTMINFINREYCKKLIVLLPGQKHPEQYHQKKEETFHVLFGEVMLNLDGKEKQSRAGDIITVERGQKHIFNSPHGAIIEEISSTHYKNDSFYTDPQIAKNRSRKTLISYWMD